MATGNLNNGTGNIRNGNSNSTSSSQGISKDKDNNNLVKALKAATDAINDLLRATKENTKEQKEQTAETKKTLADLKADNEARQATERANRKTQAKVDASYNLHHIGESITDSITKAINSLGTTLSKVADGLDSYIENQASYYSDWTTRLQGSDKNYSTMTKLLSSAVGTSAYIQQTKVFEKLNELVSEGINYNVEYRAFLETISDKIATTFDSANGTLYQLIRLQQEDSTTARLGMEASLTSFFNSMFEDTSYLSNTYDSVTQTLLNASGTMTASAATEWEYTIQKWLGSLGSLGANSSTLTTIAQGLSYLATGDVDSLSSNSSLQNLLVMAANMSGLSYSDLLTNGLNATNTNQLMAGLVSYLAQIGSSSNNVVRSQYAELFGVEVSDFTAALELARDGLETVYDTTLSYSEAIQEVSDQLNNLSSRTIASEMVQNVVSNVLQESYATIASDSTALMTYLIADVIDDTVGGINIPSVLAFGTGVTDLGTVSDWMKTGLVGYGLFSTMASVLTNLNQISGFDLSAFDASTTTKRGSGLAVTTNGSQSGTSLGASYYIGNSDSSEIYSSSISSAQSEAKSVSGLDESDTSSDLLEIIRDSIDVNVQAIKETLEEIYDKLPDSWAILGGV